MPPSQDDFCRALDRALELQRLASEAWGQVHHTLGAPQEVRRTPAVSPAELTPRETQVITLIGTGMSNRSIARQLRISERTVKSHLHSIFAKLGVATRGEAIAQLSGGPPPGWLCPGCSTVYHGAGIRLH
ncbi:helix-turn-helix transcriptional regulator [Saccharothrix xinjiangensis]|uniref:Response regulator transcription factor n=1 Tax=Saccharothrix xinjiangensis TaxID=204798 RepID=A0ABV9Y3N1_9PSEU